MCHCRMAASSVELFRQNVLQARCKMKMDALWNSWKWLTHESRVLSSNSDGSEFRPSKGFV
eukprot:1894005-Amphidinium_carterae.1